MFTLFFRYMPRPRPAGFASLVALAAGTAGAEGPLWQDTPLPVLELLWEGEPSRATYHEAVTFGVEWERADADGWGVSQLVALGGMDRHIPAATVFDGGFDTPQMYRLTDETLRRNPSEYDWAAVTPFGIKRWMEWDRPVLHSARDREDGVVREIWHQIDGERSEVRYPLGTEAPSRVIDLAQGHGMRALLAEARASEGPELHAKVARAGDMGSHVHDPVIAEGRVSAFDVTLTWRDNGEEGFASNTVSLVLAGELHTPGEKPGDMRAARNAEVYLERHRVPLGALEEPLAETATTFAAAGLLPPAWRAHAGAGEIAMRLAGVQTLTDRLTEHTDAMPIWLVFELALNGGAKDALGGVHGVLVVRLDWEGAELRVRHRREILLGEPGLRRASLRGFEVLEDGTAALLISRDWLSPGPSQQILALLRPDLSVAGVLDGKRQFQFDTGDPAGEPALLDAIFVLPDAGLGLVSRTRTGAYTDPKPRIYSVAAPDRGAASATLKGAASDADRVAKGGSNPAPEQAETGGSLAPAPLFQRKAEALAVLREGTAALDAMEAFYTPVSCPPFGPMPEASWDFAKRSAFVEAFEATRTCLVEAKDVFFAEHQALSPRIDRLEKLLDYAETEPVEWRNGYIGSWNRVITRYNTEFREVQAQIMEIDDSLVAALAAYQALP